MREWEVVVAHGTDGGEFDIFIVEGIDIFDALKHAAHKMDTEKQDLFEPEIIEITEAAPDDSDDDDEIEDE